MIKVKLWASILSFMLIIIFSVRADVLEKLGATKDSEGNIHFNFGTPPLKEILSWDAINRVVIHGQDLVGSINQLDPPTLPAVGLLDKILTPKKKTAETKKETVPPEMTRTTPISPYFNHRCHDFTPELNNHPVKHLQRGLTSSQVHALLGEPTQKTWCFACPIWKYNGSVLNFKADQTLRSWQGPDFIKKMRAPSATDKYIQKGMTKDQVWEVMGFSATAAHHHNVWRYGKSYVIFSKKDGRVVHFLEMDSSLKLAGSANEEREKADLPSD